MTKGERRGPDIRNVKWVVVLGGGHISDPKLPGTSQLSDSATVRVVEGVRLHKMIPGTKILLSGGVVFDPVPNARVMAAVAVAIGVNEQDLVLELDSKDTKDEAIIVKEMVGNDRFILVTSASHMPRSVALFKKHGMNPIPAPTGHLVKERQSLFPRRPPRPSCAGRGLPEWPGIHSSVQWRRGQRCPRSGSRRSRRTGCHSPGSVYNGLMRRIFPCPIRISRSSSSTRGVMIRPPFISVVSIGSWKCRDFQGSWSTALF